jgi:hypothetical protein
MNIADNAQPPFTSNERNLDAASCHIAVSNWWGKARRIYHETWLLVKGSIATSLQNELQRMSAPVAQSG